MIDDSVQLYYESIENSLEDVYGDEGRMVSWSRVGPGGRAGRERATLGGGERSASPETVLARS